MKRNLRMKVHQALLGVLMVSTMITLSIVTVSGQASIGQQSDDLHQVKVGEQFPNHRFSHVLNYPSGAMSISDLNGKVVLFDLWSTSCTGCILSWPKLVSLQQKFKDRIQIVLVNPWQNEKQISEMFSKRKRIAGVDMTLPCVYGDSAILKYFPTETVPHVVWIDNGGTVRSVTHGTLLTEKNIQAALDHNNFQLPQKLNNAGRSYDATKPLYVNGNGGMSQKTFWQSIVTQADPTLWRGQSVYGTDSMSFCIGTNVSVSELYQIAYGRDKSPTGGLGWLPPNRVIFETGDTSKYLYKVSGEVNYDNFVNYSLFGPPMSAERIQSYMQEDLKRYFPLDAKWENRKALCYVWKCSDTLAISYKSGNKVDFVYTANFNANKITMAQIFWDLNYGTAWGNYPYPIVDETGVKGLVGGINEEGDVLSLKVLSKMLAKYKITITVEERTLPFLVIRDRTTNEN